MRKRQNKWIGHIMLSGDSLLGTYVRLWKEKWRKSMQDEDLDSWMVPRVTSISGPPLVNLSLLC